MESSGVNIALRQYGEVVAIIAVKWQNYMNPLD